MAAVCNGYHRHTIIWHITVPSLLITELIPNLKKKRKPQWSQAIIIRFKTTSKYVA